MTDQYITDDMVERVNATHLLEAEAERLSRRLSDLATLRDHFTYLGEDPEKGIRQLVARRNEVLQRVRERHDELTSAPGYDAVQDIAAVDHADRLAWFNRFDFCAAFSPWVEQPTPNMTEGISETPGVPGTSGEIGTAGLFQGGCAYGGELSDSGEHDPGDEKFWIHNWRDVIKLPPAPERSTLHYRFGVSAITNIYRAPVLSGSVMVFVTVGTTSDIAVPITNWDTVGWPVMVTLPADPPLYFGGEVPVTGKFNVAKGKTAAIALILGVITSVNQGYVQFLWGNFGTHRPVPLPEDLNYEDYGRIEYRFCPLLVAELERQAQAYFD